MRVCIFDAFVGFIALDYSIDALVLSHSLTLENPQNRLKLLPRESLEFFLKGKK